MNDPILVEDGYLVSADTIATMPDDGRWRCLRCGRPMSECFEHPFYGRIIADPPAPGFLRRLVAAVAAWWRGRA